MKRRYLTLAAAFLAALALCVPAAAEEPTQEPIALCFPGEVTAVDLTYRVTGDGSQLSVTFPAGVLADWNYIAEEHLLLLGIASSDPLDLAQPLAQISAPGASLVLEELLVNGRRVPEPVLHHTPTVLPAVAPSCEKPGLSEGRDCSRCGVVLQAQETLPATGPVLFAERGENGTLHIRGAISDSAVFDGRLLLAIYDPSGKMLTMQDLSSQDPRTLSVQLTGCADAAYGKIFRLDHSWAASANAVELTVN